MATGGDSSARRRSGAVARARDFRLFDRRLRIDRARHDQETCVEACLLGLLLRDVDSCRHAFRVMSLMTARVWLREPRWRWKPFTACLYTRVWEKSPAGSPLKLIVLICAVQNPSRDRKCLVEQNRKHEIPAEFFAEAIYLALNLIEDEERVRVVGSSPSWIWPNDFIAGGVLTGLLLHPVPFVRTRSCS
jgi:hypothetical protein